MTTPERDPRAILEARARALAKPLATAEAAGVDMLTFRVGRERFAIESRFVAAVFRLTDLVPLPGATSPVVGLTRWRGDVLTVLDIRRTVGAVAGALDDLGRVIVVGETAAEFGVLADAVDDIARIDTSALHPVPAERKLDGESLLLGVTNDAVHVVAAAALIARQTDTHATPDGVSTTSSAPTL
jgi:chemotaxis signal transduction protein